MTTHRLQVGLAASALAFAAFTGTAAAQVTGCAFSDCTPQGTEVTAPATTTSTTTGGAVLGEGATAETTPSSAVEGESATAAAPAAAAAPSGSLPFTGGDVAGLVLIGGAAIGAGALMIRRSRTEH